MTYDGNPPRQHLRPVDLDEPPFDPYYDTTPPSRTPRPGTAAPADRDAETAVLSALVTPPTNDGHHPGTHLATILETTDFYWPEHQTIWDTWHHLHQTHAVPPDLVTLNAAILTTRDEPAIRAVTNLIGNPANAALADQHARIVRDHARLRVALEAGTTLTQLARTGDVTQIDHYMAEALQRVEEATLRWGARPTLTIPTTWAPVDLDPVLAGEHLDPPPTMLARTDGTFLLYDGAVHTIAGESESGKTWLTLIAAIQLIADGDRVVFIDFEDRADRVIGRLLALGATPTQIRDHFAYIRPDRPLDNDGRAQLEPHLVGARLAIVDGVTEAMTTHGFDLNSNADSALFQALIPRWIADHGPAVVLIDHVVKDKEKQLSLIHI